MKPSVLYKTCAGLLFFFAVTHTVGMIQPGGKGPRADAVLSSMQQVQFDIMGSSRSFWDFYLGFGLLLTVCLLFLGVHAWQLARLASTSRVIARAMGGPMSTCLVAIAVLCWMYFFIAPAIVSSLAAACAIAASQGVRRDDRAGFQEAPPLELMRR